MTLVRGGLAAVAMLLAAAPLAATLFAAEADMVATANGFLAVYGSFHPSDGIPDNAGRSRLAPYLSPGLNKLLADGAAAEARFAAKVKGSPPLIEGDLFSSMFEGATAWKLGACSVNGNVARCPVNFTHTDSEAAARGLDRYPGAGEHAARLASWTTSPMAADFSSAIPAASPTP